jgi:hypothetical protein
MKTALAAWILMAIESLAPSTRTPFRDIPESVAQRRARYEATAEAFADAIAELPDNVMPVRAKDRAKGEAWIAAWAVGVALHESGFLRSVDTGARVGDGGRAWCVMQVNLAPGKTTAEGWTGKDLVSDRTKCARAGIAILARHMAGCSRLPFADRTSGYASGTCQRGVPAAQRQAAIVARILRLPTAAAPPPAPPAPALVAEGRAPR